MTVNVAKKSGLVSAKFTIESEHFSCSFRVSVPSGSTTLADLLPIARSLSDAIVQQTARAVRDSGEQISCTSGCGACCRNLVAITEVEARRIGDVLVRLPEPRRSTVLGRFSEARDQLDRAGLLQQLQSPEHCTPDDYSSLVGTYFSQGIACPFLEQESCTIYDERPLGCREYLVTSSPALCARLDSTGVCKVKLPFTVFNAVARVGNPSQGAFCEKWVPLILAPQWAKTHPEQPEPRPGLELLQELLGHLNA